MSIFSSLKISHKLLLSSLLNTILLGALIASAFFGLKDQKGLVEGIFADTFHHYVAATDLIDPIKDLNISVYNALNMSAVGFGDEELEQAVSAVKLELKHLSESIDSIVSGLDDASPRHKQYVTIKKDFVAYREAMEQVLTAVTFDPDVAFASLTPAEALYAKLEKELAALKRLEAERMQRQHAESHGMIDSISTNMLVFSGVIAGVMLLLAYLTSQLINRPILRLMKFATALSRGDLSKRFDADGKDEIAQLGRTLNGMARQVEEAMATAQDKASEAQDEAEAAKKAEEQALEMRRDADMQKERLLDAARKLETMALALKDSAAELSARTEGISNAIIEQRDRFAENAAAVTEMSATAVSIAQNAENASKESGTASDDAEKGAETLLEVINSMGLVKDNGVSLQQHMQELGGYVQTVGNIMGIINDIADQTNLLALNAAIEAARAGEAGRGFAVVADEVRKLAEKTISATADVGQSIAAIQGSTSVSTTSTENALKAILEVDEKAKGSGKVFEDIVAAVRSVSNDIQSIATAAEQQSCTSEAISQASEEVNSLSLRISEEMELTAAATRQVADLADELHGFVETIRS